MSWSTSKRNGILAVLILIIAAPIVYFFFTYYHKDPTCFDGIQNQNEEAVDCGGSCTLLCSNDTLAPIVLWRRLFPISEGYYTFAAVVQNPNLKAGSRSIGYTIKVYDVDGVVIYDRNGALDLAPGENELIVEPGVPANNRIPGQAILILEEENIVWERMEIYKPTIETRDIVSAVVAGKPRISAKLFNNSLKKVKLFNVAVVVYDVNNNAIGASETLVDVIDPEGEVPIIFTWPKPFPAEIGRIDIVPQLPSVPL